MNEPLDVLCSALSLLTLRLTLLRSLPLLHRNQIFIVMELCSGGDLYSRDPYTEEESARIISSILSAVSYMHQQGIVHRYVSTLYVLPRV